VFCYTYIAYLTIYVIKHNWLSHSLYYPTDAHNVKKVELLKHVKIIEAAPTCFGLHRNHHQGAAALTAAIALATSARRLYQH